MRHHLAIVLPALVLAFPAVAAEDKPIAVTIDNYIAYVSTGTLVTSSEITVTLTGQAGDWTLTAEAWAGLTGEFISADTLTLEMPTLILGAGSEQFGLFEIGDQDNALEAACVTPTLGSTHFGTEDLMTVSTCGAYSGGQIVSYTTPSFGGFSLKASAMTDLKGTIDVGEVDSSVSALLGYTQEEGDVTLAASLAVDTALSVKGGGMPLPTTVHAGVNVGIDGWIFGAAGQYESASLAGGNSWAGGVGISKEIFEGLVVGAEVATNQYEDAGNVMNEVNFGATAEYAIVPDQVLIDAAANVLRRTGGGVDETVTSVGAGLSVWF